MARSDAGISMNLGTEAAAVLTPREAAKRNDLMARKPYVAKKLAAIAERAERGEISPIIRLEESYLCNFHCTHCCAEEFMERSQTASEIAEVKRRQITLDDIRELSRQADEIGIARFVITGGEPLIMRNPGFDEVVAAIDPEKHYVITDTNGWFLDPARARHIKSIGVEKVQMSLDSSIEEEHDRFRNKPGSYKRVLRAIDACKEAGLNLILSTCLVKGRARTEEFVDLCRLAKQKEIGLYVTYAKPVGQFLDNMDCVIDKEDADAVRHLEKDYPVFTHMTPSYGMFQGCITVKGIVTVTSTGEIEPCPYIHGSLGNFRETHLRDILERGMRNKWLGPHRPDCLIGEDPEFIRLHTKAVHEHQKAGLPLPVPYGKMFSDADFT